MITNFEHVQFKYFRDFVAEGKFTKQCRLILHKVCNEEFILINYPDSVIDLLKIEYCVVTRNSETLTLFGMDSYLAIYIPTNESSEYYVKIETKTLYDKTLHVVVHHNIDSHTYQQIHDFIADIKC